MAEQKIVIDPEFADWLPHTTKEQDAEFKQTIRADGKIIDPLVVWKSTRILVDGHRRKKIADELGLGYRVEEREFSDRAEAMLWAYYHQERRRNFTDYQRTQMALKLEPLIAAQGKEKERARKTKNAETEDQNIHFPSEESGKVTRTNLSESLLTRTKISNLAGVSEGTVGKVKMVEAEGASALKKLAETGEVSITAAAAVASTLPKSEQRKIAEQGPEAVKEKAAEIRREKSEEKREQSDAEKTASDGDEPWSALETEMEDVFALIRKASKQLQAACNFDPSTKRAARKWAYQISHAGTIELLAQVIRNVKENLPAETSDKPPGFKTRREAKLHEQVGKSRIAG